MRILGIVIFNLILVCSSAFAIPIAVHSGSTDPENEGWVLHKGDVGTVSGGSEISGGTKYSYWQISHPSTHGDPVYYMHDLSASDLDDNWYLSAWIRVVDSREDENIGNIFSGAFLVNDDYNSWGLLLGNQKVGILNSDLTFSHSYEMDTRETYHLYEIYFKHNDPGFEDDTASIWIDGKPIFTDIPRSDVWNISSYESLKKQMVIGAITNGAKSIVNYSDLAFHDQVPVPEPATFFLMLVGLLLFYCLITKKQY